MKTIKRTAWNRTILLIYILFNLVLTFSYTVINVGIRNSSVYVILSNLQTKLPRR